MRMRDAHSLNISRTSALSIRIYFFYVSMLFARNVIVCLFVCGTLHGVMQSYYKYVLYYDIDCVNAICCITLIDTDSVGNVFRLAGMTIGARIIQELANKT